MEYFVKLRTNNLVSKIVIYHKYFDVFFWLLCHLATLPPPPYPDGELKLRLN
jgi:hypothetical protein